jgi:hypothetical protein
VSGIFTSLRQNFDTRQFLVEQSAAYTPAPSLLHRFPVCTAPGIPVRGEDTQHQEVAEMVGIGKAKGAELGKRVAPAAGVFFMALVAAANIAHAAPLGLTLQGSPDISSDFIDLNYNAEDKTLTAYGFAEEIRSASAAAATIRNGTFEIIATISNSGEVKEGTITITGAVPALGLDGTLLSGNIRAVGYESKDGPLELQFDTSGGALAYDVGPLVNVILSHSGFAGDFAHDFSSGSIAVAGTGW